MKRIIAIGLLLCVVFSQTEIHQVFRLPMFLQHYAEHCHEHPGITLGEFVKMHYFDKTIVDHDYKHDQQLPYKTDDCNQSSMNPIVAFPVAHVKVHVDHALSISFSIPHTEGIPSSATTDIFQPPKQA